MVGKKKIKKAKEKKTPWKVFSTEKMRMGEDLLQSTVQGTYFAYSGRQARRFASLRRGFYLEREKYDALPHDVWLVQVKELVKKRVRVVEVDRFKRFPLSVTIGVAPPESNQVKITFIFTEDNKIMETVESKRGRKIIPEEFYRQAVKMAYGIFTDNEPQ